MSGHAGESQAECHDIKVLGAPLGQIPAMNAIFFFPLERAIAESSQFEYGFSPLIFAEVAVRGPTCCNKVIAVG